MADDPLEALLDLVPSVQLLEHSPGNLRLRFRLSSLAMVDRALFDTLSRAVPGILHTRASLFRRTLSIDYDPDRIGFDVWEEILSLHEHPEKRADVLNRLRVLVDRHKA